MVEEVFAEIETTVGIDEDPVPVLAGSKEMVESTEIGGYTDSDSIEELEIAVAVYTDPLAITLEDETPIGSAVTPVLILIGLKVDTGYDGSLVSVHGGFLEAWSTAVALLAGSQTDMRVASTDRSILRAWHPYTKAYSRVETR